MVELPLGQCCPITANRLFWEHYEDLTYEVSLLFYSESRLVQRAMLDAREMQRSFEESFIAVCKHASLLRHEALLELRPAMERCLNRMRRE